MQRERTPEQEPGGILSFYKRFRGEAIMFIVSFVSSLLGLVSFLLKLGDPLVILVLTTGAVIIILLFSLLINVKRFYKLRFRQLEDVFRDYQARARTTEQILVDYFGYFWRENQYFNRLQHFVDEKRKLAETLVNETLPSLFAKIREENPKLKKINIFLDSGTTITPVFPHLVRFGLPVLENVDTEIFTNNLAGVDEIHKMDQAAGARLRDRDFQLIGGQPLNNYRATTGDLTQRVLQVVWNEQAESDGETIGVGIITANWLIGGRTLDNLRICARGEGHLEFKSALIDNCEYLIVVAPLGKIIPVDTLKQLITAVDRAYEARELPREKRNRTLLLTSLRPPHSVSPLRNMSTRFEAVRRNNESKNFIFCQHCPVFDPKTDRQAAILADLPHEYVRERFVELFREPPL